MSAGLANVAVVRTTAASDQSQVRQVTSEGAVEMSELDGIAVIQFGRHVQFRMA